MFWVIFSMILFLVLGLYSGFLCEKAITKKLYGEAVFFGLCANAGAIFAAAIAIMLVLVSHQGIADEVLHKIFTCL
ncbi:MAG: hypothetical protein WCT49_02755 [Candidatus Paceibacterota bacterium]|jgi:hypothetical protein|nr:hypothetical protein [Candidatus Paceibacterota bacterium]